jgi:hypothetical protein
VFPAFRQIVPADELTDLGQHFADLEHQQFGRTNSPRWWPGWPVSSTTSASTTWPSSPLR